MANLCDTTYKVTGKRESVMQMWDILKQLEVNSRNVSLSRLAESYGIDYEERGIGVRGHIYFADLEEEKDGTLLLSFDTETAWSACYSLFLAIEECSEDSLSFSYREIEPGCEVFYIHDEGDFFPESLIIICGGDENFEEYNEDTFTSIKEIATLWCELMGLPEDFLKGKGEEEITDFINAYEYEDERFFNIYEFSRI